MIDFLKEILVFTEGLGTNGFLVIMLGLSLTAIYYLAKGYKNYLLENIKTLGELSVTFPQLTNSINEVRDHVISLEQKIDAQKNSEEEQS